MSGAFDPEQMLESKESFESISTENSDEDGGSGNRAYVPCGVGATVQVTDDGHLKVLGVVTGSELMVGDILLMVNGESVKGCKKEDVAKLLQGRAGSHVTVHVMRQASSDAIPLRLTRHYKARKSATRAHRGTRSPANMSPRDRSSPLSPRSPAERSPAASPGAQQPPPGAFPPPTNSRNAAGVPRLALGSLPTPPVADVRVPKPSTRSDVTSQASFDPEASLSSKSVDPEASYASGRSYDPEASYLTADPSFDPARTSLSPDKTATPKASPPAGGPARVSGRGGATSGAGWEASFDPERASFASEVSFDPEASSYGGVGGRGAGGHGSGGLETMRSEPSIDPEASTYSGVGGSASASPARRSAATEPSFDPESQMSEVSFDAEGVRARAAAGEPSFDPESRMSEPSFDPELRGVPGARSFDPEKLAGVVPVSANASFDPEASSTSVGSKRDGMRDYERIAAMLRSAIAAGDGTKVVSEASAEGGAEGGAGVQRDPSLDPDAMADELAAEDSRVCSTVLSFDPEREWGGQSREFGGAGADGPNRALGAGQEPSFDPSEATGVLSGPEYDPSMEFAGQGRSMSEASFDPEKTTPGNSKSEKSFDPDAEDVDDDDDGDNAVAAAGPGGLAVAANGAPDKAGTRGTSSGNTARASVARPISIWGASVCVRLASSGGRFHLESVWGDAEQSAASVGDEVIKVDGLALHGMLLEEATEVLEGPEGSVVDLELITADGGHSKESPPPDPGAIIQQYEEKLKKALAEAAVLEAHNAELKSKVKDMKGHLQSAEERAGRHAQQATEAEERAEAMRREAAEQTARRQEREEVVERLRTQIEAAADFNDKAAEAEAIQMQELKEAKEEIVRLRSGSDDITQGDRALVEQLRREAAERDAVVRELQRRAETAEAESVKLKSAATAAEETATKNRTAERADVEERAVKAREDGESDAVRRLMGAARGMGVQYQAGMKMMEAEMELARKADAVRGWMEDSDDLQKVAEVLDRLADRPERREAAGVLKEVRTAGEVGGAVVTGLKELLEKEEGRVRRHLESNVSAGGGKGRGVRRQRSRSSRRSSQASFDPVDLAGDDSDEESGRSSGGRVTRARSEVSFDASVWADDDSDEDGDDDFCGIGASFRTQNSGEVEVIGLVKDGPAERSGVLQVGDVLLTVDGVGVRGKDHGRVLEMVMGPEGTAVLLEVLRDGSVVVTVEVLREWTRSMERAAPLGQKSGEFDPSEFAGSESDGSDQECGVGLSVGKDERGRYHVTEVVLGGAADSTGAVRVGDLLEGIEDDMLNADVTHASVMGLLRGPARTSVTLHLVRDGRPYSVPVQRDPSDARVWRVLSEYSSMHPEDFDVSDDDEVKADATATKPTTQGPAVKAIAQMKRTLMEKNDDIAVLNARMEEAERAKEGLLTRINQLLVRAQDAQIKSKANTSPSPSTNSDPSPQKPSTTEPARAESKSTSADGSEDVVQGCGVGIHFKQDRNGFFRVVDMVAGGAAARGGRVMIGDVLLMADGQSVRGLALTELAELTLGPEGSWLELGLQRVDSQGLLVVVHVTLQRSRVWTAEAIEASSGRTPDAPEPSRPSRPSGHPAQTVQQADNGAEVAAEAMCGVGITFGRDKAGFFVVRTLAPAGPAAMSDDVQVQDTLVTVDGVSVKGIRYDALTQLILGEQDSPVLLGLRRGPNGTHVDVELRRARVGPVGRPAEKKKKQAGPPAVRSTVENPVAPLSTLTEEASVEMHASVDKARSLALAPSSGPRSPTTADVHTAERVRFYHPPPQPSSTGSSGPPSAPTSGNSAVPMAPGSGGMDATRCGVGLTFRKDAEGFFRVLGVNSDTAREAGLEPRHTLVGVEGQNVQNLDHTSLSGLVLGPLSTLVELTLRRTDGSLYSTLIVRHKPLAAPGAPDSHPPVQCGVGAVLRRQDGYVVVTELWAGSSAELSQLVAVGDVVEMVGGKATVAMSDRELERSLLGTPGSMCVLQLWKPNSNSTRIEVALTRTTPLSSAPHVASSMIMMDCVLLAD